MKNLFLTILTLLFVISCGNSTQTTGLNPQLTEEGFLELVAATGDCSEETRSKLTQEQRDTLLIGSIHKNSEINEENGSIPDYPSLILERDNQLIVLLGEVHIKDRLGHEIGSNILKNFKIHMLEGVFQKETELVPAFLRQNLSDRGQKVEEQKEVFGSSLDNSSNFSIQFEWDIEKNRDNSSLKTSLENINCEDVEEQNRESCNRRNQTLSSLQENINDKCLETGLENKECSEVRLSFALESYYFIDPQNFYPEQFREDPNIDIASLIEFEGYVLGARNERMVEASLNLVDRYNIKESLVIVGAAHLPGMKNLYEDQGYSSCRLHGESK